MQEKSAGMRKEEMGKTMSSMIQLSPAGHLRQTNEIEGSACSA